MTPLTWYEGPQKVEECRRNRRPVSGVRDATVFVSAEITVEACPRSVGALEVFVKPSDGTPD